MLFKGFLNKRVFNFFKWSDLEIYEKVILDTKDILFAQFSLFVSLLIIFLSVSFFFTWIKTETYSTSCRQSVELPVELNSIQESRFAVISATSNF